MEQKENLNTSINEENAPEAAPDTAGTENEQENFALDENGDIVIPDDTEEDSQEDEKPPQSADGQSDEREKEAEPDERDKEIAALKAKLAKIEKQGKASLEKLGVKGDDFYQSLVRIAAESDGVSPEEYEKTQSERLESEEALRYYRKQRFEAKKREDLESLKKSFPGAEQYKDIDEIPNAEKFKRFRDLGLSAKEAYVAANPDAVLSNAASSARQASLNEAKSHLQSVVPKGSKDNSVTMPRAELLQWRDLFPDKSDKEILNLYKNTK